VAHRHEDARETLRGRNNILRIPDAGLIYASVCSTLLFTSISSYEFLKVLSCMPDVSCNYRVALWHSSVIMKTMKQTNLINRNFNSISASAKSLLFMKGHTNIPFARQTAELIKYPEKYNPDFSNKDITFWARVVHFENRYWSIDQLLTDLPIKNILELSSGFSFRGLETKKQKGIYYIDTDLPDVLTAKKKLVLALNNESFNNEGILEFLPLNALDDKQFYEIVSHFPDGEIVIVNEGLLMYLDRQEKKKLCGIIHKILKERGGYWITADIYLKSKQEKLDLKYDTKTKEFFKQHRVEENKFESFEETEIFFKEMSFTVDKEANIKRSKLSSLKYLLKNATIKQLFKMRNAGNIQATWRLRIAGDE
jgi:O-methyltransferase involved in polyketide biosynthesis